MTYQERLNEIQLWADVEELENSAEIMNLLNK